MSVSAGKRFRLERATLAIAGNGPARQVVTVPSGSIIQIASQLPDDHGIIQVVWDGRTVQMFEVDIDGRGTEIQAAG